MNNTKRPLMTLVAAAATVFASPAFAAPSATAEKPADKAECDTRDSGAESEGGVKEGTHKGMLRFSGGGGFHAISDKSILSLHGEFEYMINDNIGFKGMGYIPITGGPGGVSELPGYLGLNIHFLPRSKFDVYIGGGAGGAIASHDKYGTKLAPAVHAGAGAIVYLFSVFYGKVEAGYEMKEYATKGFYQDLSSPYVAAHGGFYF